MFSVLLEVSLIKALDTGQGLFPGYQFLYFHDSAQASSYEGMLYRGETFEDCSVMELDIIQSLYADVGDTVFLFRTLFDLVVECSL